MQEKILTDITDKAFLNHEQKPGKIKSQMKALATENDALVSHYTRPNYERTPNSGELIQMRQYAVSYKKQNKKASKREVRRAVQRKFHIRIYK